MRMLLLCFFIGCASPSEPIPTPKLTGHWVTDGDFIQPRFIERIVFDGNRLIWSLWSGSFQLRDERFLFEASGKGLIIRVDLTDENGVRDYVTISRGQTMGVFSYNDSSKFKFIDGFYREEMNEDRR